MVHNNIVRYVHVCDCFGQKNYWKFNVLMYIDGLEWTWR